MLLSDEFPKPLTILNNLALIKSFPQSHLCNLTAIHQLHRPIKFYDQTVSGQWAHVSGLFFQADFKS